MTRRATVRIRSTLGVDTQIVDASVLATKAALVDMGRRQADVSPEQFVSGEVVA